MQFLLENWIYILALAAFVALHLIGFGCSHARGHGSHRGTHTSGGHRAGGDHNDGRTR